MAGATYSPAAVSKNLLAVTLAVGFGVLVFLHYRATTCLVAMSWDPASHALEGVKLYNNLIGFRPISFWIVLTGMTHWPPLPAVVSIPFFLVLGRNATAATMPSIFAFVGILIVAWLTLRRRFDTLPAFAGYLFYLTLVFSSPLLLRFAIVVMYELPGALLTLAGIVVYWSWSEQAGAADETSERNYGRGFGLLLLALLLTKWNYGLQLLLFVSLVEWFRASRSERLVLIRGIVAPLLDPRVMPVLSGLGAVVGLLAFSIVVTGGWQAELLGHQVTVTHLPNPLYVGLVLFTIKAWRVLRRNSEALRAVRPFHVDLFRYAMVPYFVWLLYPVPNRLKALIYHLSWSPENAIPRLSPESATFYAEVFTFDGLRGRWQAAIVIGLVVLGAWLARRSRVRGALIPFGFVAFGWLTNTFLTANKEPRFLVTLIPVVFLLAAWTVASLAARGRSGIVAAVMVMLLVAPTHEYVAGALHGVRPPLFSWIQPEGFCFGTEAMVGRVRREVVAPIAGRASGTTAGHAETEPLCQLIEWELHCAYPHFSRVPSPAVCGWGRDETPQRYLQRHLADDSLDWVVLWDKDGAPKDPELAALEDELRRRARKSAPVSLPEVRYRGTIYRLDDD